jgi:putative transposase
MNASQHNIPHGSPLSLDHPGSATSFATVRLAGSLPAHIERELLEQKHACRDILANISRASEIDVVVEEEELLCLEEFDRHLMKHGGGPDWLSRAEVAALVADALRQGDRKAYDLWLYCIMPNHIHCVIDTSRFHDNMAPVPRPVSALKRHTAHEANRILKRSGIFWHHEHLEYPVRTSRIFHRILWNVLSDPVRSGICRTWYEWPWSYCRPGLLLPGTK